jgi:hypothetical protein
MIELTPEQRQAVRQGQAVRVVDPDSHDAYVVFWAEVYERLAGPWPRPIDEPPAGIQPQLFRSMQAFWQDLPVLIGDTHLRGRWTAYHGGERISVGKTQTEVYQDCLRLGLERGQFYVGLVEEDETPPWGRVQGDRSLYEFTEQSEGAVPPDPA